MTAFEILSNYFDPGTFTLPVSSLKRVLIDGKQIQYGPTLSGTITKVDSGYSVALDSIITAEVEGGIHAKVSGLDITPTATFALGTGVFGFVAFRKKINLSFGDA